jgi:hypothetical protein
MKPTITLYPAELEDVKRRAARETADSYFEGLDVDELNTMDLATCASFLGISAERAGRLLPWVEVGPRSRRVRICDYKAFLESRKKDPKRAP